MSSEDKVYKYFTLGPGSFFGDNNIIYDYPSSYTYMADETNTLKTFTVTKEIFLRLCRLYPKTFNLLKERALKKRRIFRNQKLDAIGKSEAGVNMYARKYTRFLSIIPL